MRKNLDSKSTPRSSPPAPRCTQTLVGSVGTQERAALPRGRSFLQIILRIVQTQVAQRLPAHLKEESQPVDVLGAQRVDQDHGAQSGDEDQHSEGTHGGYCQGSSYHQEEQVYLVRVHSIYYPTSREKENSNMSKKKINVPCHNYNPNIWRIC